MPRRPLFGAPPAAAVETPDAPAPSAAVVVAESAEASSATRAEIVAPPERCCVLCGAAIVESAHDYVVRQCSHNVHAECAHAAFVRGSVGACTVCRAAPRGGVIDAGADPELRAAAIEALRAETAGRGTTTSSTAPLHRQRTSRGRGVQ